MKSAVIVISIFLSGIFTYLMYLFARNFVHAVDRVLDRVFDVRFGYWELQFIVFALSFGLIPFISLIPWLIRRHRNVTSLLIYNVVSFSLISLMVCSTGLYLILFSPDGGIFNTVKQPSLHFWNYVFAFSTFFTALILVSFALVTRKKFRLKNSIRHNDLGRLGQIS